MRILAIVLGLVAVAAPLASAGDRPTLAGCSCVNECPLAQQANERRSSGGEAVLASSTVRADFVRALAANLKSF